MAIKKADDDLEEAKNLFQDNIAKNAITEADLNDGKYAVLENKYSKAQEKADTLRGELTSRRRRAASIVRFIEKVSSFDKTFPEFTEELWLGLADTITVKDKKNYVVRFKNGVEIPVEV